MKAIKFKRGGSNTILGNFAPGDVARCSDALARHLVDELDVAAYHGAPEPAAEPPKRKGRK